MRLITALSCVAIATALVTAAAASGNGQVVYTDRQGWTLTYPDDLKLEQSALLLPGFGGGEVTVASFEPETAYTIVVSPGGGSITGIRAPANRDGVFPDDGVALRIVAAGGCACPVPIFIDIGPPETRFPLRVADLSPSLYFHQPVTPLVRRIYANGLSYTVELWVGPSAEGAAVDRLDAVLGSLRFPPLEQGTVVGSDYTVLGLAREYPLGSATRMVVGGRPLYLVHAPAGWYALGWRPFIASDSTGNGKCRMNVRRAPLRFVCPRYRAAWDRIGRPLRGSEDALGLIPAKRGQDGHILLANFTLNPAIGPGHNGVPIYWPNWGPVR